MSFLGNALCAVNYLHVITYRGVFRMECDLDIGAAASPGICSGRKKYFENNEKFEECDNGFVLWNWVKRRVGNRGVFYKTRGWENVKVGQEQALKRARGL